MASTKELIEKGDIFFDDGKFQKALENYKKALDIEPKNVDALICCGLCYRNMEEYDKAIEYYDNALEIEPDNKTALNNKGYVLECKGDIEAAIDFYKKSLEIDPNYDMPLVNITKIYLDRKDYRAAIKVYKNALHEDPINTANWIDLGRAYRFIEKYDKAILAYYDALKLAPSNKIAWNNIGYVHFVQKDYKKAIETLTKSLEIDWLYDLPYSNLNKVYKNMIDENITDFRLWKQLANAFLVARAYKRALDASNRMLEINFEDEDAKQLHEKILKVKEKYDMNPLLLEKIEQALNLFSSISTSVLLADIIEYIRYKTPDLIFTDDEIKFNIFETIQKKSINAKLVVNKLVFYKPPIDNTKVDYMK
ncbi:MAG: tetratricopeptide repeat protein [Promethearchaeota archaeon]|nr:MAG: tetratricopeptide repeat protein [Candidatus Lokiarchaeota archaeon]